MEGERRPYVGWQWKPIVKTSLAAHGNLRCAPVDVAGLQRGHLAGSEPQACAQQENRAVPATAARREIRGGQEALDLTGRQRPSQCALLMRPHHGPLDAQEAQPRPDGDCEHAGRIDAYGPLREAPLAAQVVDVPLFDMSARPPF
jgi:hypothetical protein